VDVFSLIYKRLIEWVITPITEQFYSIFSFNGRLGVLFLCASYGVAYGLFRFRKQHGLTDAPSFWQFIGGSRVYFHRSAWLDCRYYLLRKILKLALVLPIVHLVDPYILRSGDYLAFFNNLWGARPRLGDGLSLALLYGLGVFLVKDFAHYWVHRAFHSRWLWAFHKVHHSAPVLVPATASRIHFVERIVGTLSITACLGLYVGTFWYLSGGEISHYRLFGVTYVVFIFNSLAANLRHTHVWLSFGPVLEHALNSPAQHQIHHSDAPRHFNRNFGTNLSLWDWMFGTLYVTSARPEPLRFGTGERDHRRYLSVYSLIVTPFVDIAGKLPGKRLRGIKTQTPYS
jgi:sterol desaturase/sphingolipid hydroxylase (fatty acid hydroxylase superfamily)